MRSSFGRLFVAAVAVFSLAAWAEAEAVLAPPLPPPPQPTAPVQPTVAVDPNEPLRFGVQFHGDLTGGAAGLGVAASVGLGFNRVALMLTPSFVIGGFDFIALGFSVRIYLAPRRQGALVGFLRPEVQLGAAVSGFGGGALFGSLGGGGGVEYLLTRNLGFTAELGLRYSSLDPARLAAGLAGGYFGAFGSFGIMLHQ